MTHEEAIEKLKILKEDYWDDDGYGHESKLYDDTVVALDMAIKALSEERKKGRWIRHESPNLGKCMKVLYECSVCKAWLGCEYFLRRSFCPNCGARMEGGSEDDKNRI